MNLLVFYCRNLQNLVRKRINFEALLGRRFGTEFGSLLVASWSHFGVRNRSKKASDSNVDFRSDFGGPKRARRDHETHWAYRGAPNDGGVGAR